MSHKTIITPSSVLLCSILSATAWADGHSPKEAKQPLKLQDVTVTGTKEGEVKLQKVPSAISAFTEEDIKASGIDNIRDLPLQTPGLNLTHNGQSARLYMRGIGSNLDFIGSDPSVTVHVDGVYQSRTFSILEDFLDVERVEVLRGPQGTLYGRNSAGGTINVITKKPEAENGGEVFVELGSYKYRSLGGVVNGVLSEDKVFGRLAIAKTEHDPYVKNMAATGVDGLLDDDSLSSRGSLRFLLSDRSELLLRADYLGVDRNPAAYKQTLLTPNGAAGVNAGLANVPVGSWAMNVTDVDPFTEIKNWGLSAEYEHKISPTLKLVSLTAYRDTDTHLREDTDGSDVAGVATELDWQQDQISQELRLQYNEDDLTWVAGAYYLQEEQESATNINKVVNIDAESDLTSYSLFGQGTYALTSALNATAGVRFSSEEKDYQNIQAHPDPAKAFDVNLTQRWSSWSPKVGLDYTYASGDLVYMNASRGFKSGGYNMTSSDPEFDPEYVWSYEVGSKLQLLDKRLQTNVSVFYYDYTDLQVQDFVQVGVLSVSNAADATVKGIEIENQWSPTYDILLEADYSFLDARYDRYDSPSGDASGDRLVASPKHKINLAFEYFRDMSAGTFSYRAEYQWQDEQFFTAPNQDVSKQKAYGLVNLRANYVSADEVWEGQVYVENLGKKAYSTSSREFPAAAPPNGPGLGITKDINPPRTVGFRLTRNF